MSAFNPERGEGEQASTSREIATVCRAILDELAHDEELKLTDADFEEIAAESAEDAYCDALSALLAADVEDPETVMRQRGIVV